MKIRDYKYHLLFWAGIYMLWLLIFRSYSISVTRTVTIQFCYLVFIMANYYGISAVIMPRLLGRKRYVLFAAAIVAMALLSGWLRALVAVQMNIRFFHVAAQTDFLTLYLTSLFNISFWVLLIIAGKMLVDRARNQRQLELLEAEKKKNELNFLKAQINPHALFNSLNTIYGYIDKSNQVARNTLLQFSELLRYQLYDCSSEHVALGSEIAYIRNYAAFQQLRNNPGLVVAINTDNIDDQLQIAPLLLIVLVENAFKFAGSITGQDIRVSIKLATINSVLYCKVGNTTDLLPVAQDGNTGGIGIANFRRRLELLYPGRHTLSIDKQDGHYTTDLKIELLCN